LRLTRTLAWTQFRSRYKDAAATVPQKEGKKTPKKSHEFIGLGPVDNYVEILVDRHGKINLFLFTFTGGSPGRSEALLVRVPFRKLRVGDVNSGDNFVFRRNARLGLEFSS
jgi:hypothetical protein